MGMWHNEERFLPGEAIQVEASYLMTEARSFPLCTHIKGRGGIKGTVRSLRKKAGFYHLFKIHLAYIKKNSS